MEQRKDIMTGIIRILILFIVGSIFLAIAGYILSFVIDIIGRIIVFVLQWAVFGGIAWYGYKYFKKPKPKEKPAEVIPEEAITNEMECAMFMLYASMAWNCVFRLSGIPVPLCRSNVDSTLFFDVQRTRV